MSKINWIFLIFFIEEYKKGSLTFIIDICILITLILNVPYFLKLYPRERKGNFFYTQQVESDDKLMQSAKWFEGIEIKFRMQKGFSILNNIMQKHSLWGRVLVSNSQ
jgi:hypothetical protein